MHNYEKYAKNKNQRSGYNLNLSNQCLKFWFSCTKLLGFAIN